MPRDSQRSKLYAAEWKARRSMNLRHFASVEECQAYVDSVTTKAWFQARWKVKIRVKGVSGSSASAYQLRQLICVSKWTQYQGTLIHEIAHIVQPRGTAGHGPEFCSILLELYRREVGEDAARVLRAAFVEGRVKHRANVIPKPRVERVQRKAAERPRPVTDAELATAADIIKRAAKQGRFGPTGRKPRTHALATARLLREQK